MSKYNSDFLNVMDSRGYIHQCTDMEALDNKASNGIVTAYIGFDCTGPSLHVGHLIQTMLLRRLQQTGHKPIVLMGGGTTKVGDPSFKDDARPLLDDTQIQQNMDAIKTAFANFLDFGDGPTDAIMVNNDDWLSQLQYIPFLRDYGRHFSINRMLSFDSVKLRLEREQSLSFLEFNYMILQAYDFLELNRRHDCMLQMGGSDQWGNIVNGVELNRRVDGKTCFGLTTPLLATSSGAKMGKTVDGAIWLNPEMRSPYDYWQYWRNTEDDDVGRFLRLFTDLPLDEVARLEALEGAELNDAKKILANEATKMCHGETAAIEAADTARRTFEEGQSGDALPTVMVERGLLDGDGVALFQLLTDVGLCKSNGEGRRLIKGGGCRINDEKVEEEMRHVTKSDVNDAGKIKLSAGKKRHALVTLS